MSGGRGGGARGGGLGRSVAGRPPGDRVAVWLYVGLQLLASLVRDHRLLVLNIRTVDRTNKKESNLGNPVNVHFKPDLT